MKTTIWSTDDKLIFEYDGTIKEAVEEAVRQGISLNHADLEGADLNGADLRGADLKEAKFYNADLSNANLIKADLEGVCLFFADLYCANLEGANLRDADFRYAKNIPNDIMPLACPSEGSFIAWKKVGNKLVKLEIPEDAKRSSATGHKCRCSKAKVLAITNLEETESYDEVYNDRYMPITYKVGEMVYPDWFNEYRWAECSHGIHFFMNKEDALNWVF